MIFLIKRRLLKKLSFCFFFFLRFISVLQLLFSAMAASSGFHVSSSPLLRLRSSSVAYAAQPPFLSPCNGRRLLAESFGLSTVTVSRQNLSVSPPSAVVEARISGTREPMTPPYNVLITGSTKGIFTLIHSVLVNSFRG